MENKYYMGESILLSATSLGVNPTYTFEFAKKTDDGWILVLNKFTSAGYAGGSIALEYPIVLNETIELGGSMKAYVKNPMKPDKPGKLTKVSSMQVVAVEKSSVTITFDEM